MKTRDTRNFGTKDTGSRSGVVHRNTAQHLIGLVNPRTQLSPRNVYPLLSRCSRVSSRRVSLSHRNISTHGNISNSRHVTRDALALPLLVPHNVMSCLSSSRILPPSKPSAGFALPLLLLATLSLTFPHPAYATIRLGSPNTVSLSQGLVGYWPLDGATTNWNANTTADLSGNGNTGALNSLSKITSPVAGKIGQALMFRRELGDNYVNAGNPTSLQITGSLTLAAWVYATALSAGDSHILTKTNAPPQGGYYLATATDNGPQQFYFVVSPDGRAVQRSLQTAV